MTGTPFGEPSTVQDDTDVRFQEVIDAGLTDDTFQRRFTVTHDAPLLRMILAPRA
jgi:hypothetical protein